MNPSVLFIFLILWKNGGSQTDSLKALRISGVRASTFQLIASGHRNLSVPQHQAFLKDDPFLYEDLNSFSLVSNKSYLNMNGIALRIFASLKKSGRCGKEISIGILIGEYLHSGLAYYCTEYFVIYLPESYKLIEQRRYYYFNIYGRNFYLPVGLYLHTDKSRYLWCTAGLEMAPGYSEYTYYSEKGKVESRGAIGFNTDPSDYHKYVDRSKAVTARDGVYRSRIPQKGFAAYLSVPFSANLRFSKKIIILRNVHFHAATAPIIYFSTHKSAGTRFGAGFKMEFGTCIAW
jgi:hypothetical protein